jgi:hypothetical protein
VPVTSTGAANAAVTDGAAIFAGAPEGSVDATPFGVEGTAHEFGPFIGIDEALARHRRWRPAGPSLRAVYGRVRCPFSVQGRSSVLSGSPNQR